MSAGKGPKPAAHAAVVYFARASQSGLIKIGCTTNLRGRMSALRSRTHGTFEFLGALQGDRTVERGMHMKFAPHNFQSEWFRDVPEIREFVASLPKLDPLPKSGNRGPLALEWAFQGTLDNYGHNALRHAQMAANELTWCVPGLKSQRWPEEFVERARRLAGDVAEFYAALGAYRASLPKRPAKPRGRPRKPTTVRRAA